MPGAALCFSPSTRERCHTHNRKGHVAVTKLELKTSDSRPQERRCPACVLVSDVLGLKATRAHRACREERGGGLHLSEGKHRWLFRVPLGTLRGDPLTPSRVACTLPEIFNLDKHTNVSPPSTVAIRVPGTRKTCLCFCHKPQVQGVAKTICFLAPGGSVVREFIWNVWGAGVGPPTLPLGGEVPQRVILPMGHRPFYFP